MRVVPVLNPLEGRRGELVAGGPAASLEQLELEGPKKLSTTELSKQSPIEPIEPSNPAARRRRPNAHEVYLRPVVGVGHGLAARMGSDARSPSGRHRQRVRNGCDPRHPPHTPPAS